MIGPIIGRIPKNKKFNYQYRYYKPDPTRDGEGIEFKRITRRGNAGSILGYAALLALIVYFIAA